MFDADSRSQRSDSRNKTDGLVSAGRHMKQPLKSTVSATVDAAYVPSIDFVATWKAKPLATVGASPGTRPVNSDASLDSQGRRPVSDDVLEQKMKLLDHRERQHRRKKRVALALVVTVVTIIPMLAVALLTLV